MEFVSHPGTTRLSTGRATRLTAAGIALAGAGLIAVQPVGPMLQDTIRQQAVQLTSSWDSLFERTSENLASLLENSNVNTLLDQYSSNWTDYAQLITGMEDAPLDAREGLPPRFITSGFAGINEALGKMIDGDESNPAKYPGLEVLLERVSDYTSQGDFFNAFNDLNRWFLYPLEDMGKSLGPVLSIPAREMMNQSSLLNEFIGPLNGWAFIEKASEPLMAPLIGAMYQLTENITAAAGGDIESLFNLPADLLNTVLNGYITPEGVFTGILTEGGIFDLLLNQWPARAAEALTVGTADLPVNVADSAEAGSGLFSVDFLSGLFDGSFWAA